MKTFEKCFLSSLIITILINLTVFCTKCENINNKVFRLHILANSNSAEDQAVKLKVRDAILEKTSELFMNAKDKSEAKNMAYNNIDLIRNIAKDELLRNGYTYDANVQIVNMHFNTRRYGNVTMPAGNYDAVRILLGQAKGNNWWCVMFPPMCLPAAGDQHELSDVLTSSEIDITSGENEYEIHFKVLEYFDAVKCFFSKLFDRLSVKQYDFKFKSF